MANEKSGKPYTPEQRAAVRRVMACEMTSYYEILSITKPSHEAEIKKSYRRLALVMHPDKNGAPQADEAFKRVSRAFQVLSDPPKKRLYDSTGVDPDSRSATASNFAQGGAAGGFNGNMAPDDLFNMFFGGGGGGPQFAFGGSGGPNVRMYSFNGGGFGFDQFGGFGSPFDPPFQRRRPAQPAANAQDSAPWWHMLPVLVMLLIMLGISYFGDSGDKDASFPGFSFMRESPYVTERTTPRYNVPYYVRPKTTKDLTARKLEQLDRRAEAKYVSILRQRCTEEHNEQLQMLRDAQGWFSRDEELHERALNLPMDHCVRLDNLGLHLQ